MLSETKQVKFRFSSEKIIKKARVLKPTLAALVCMAQLKRHKPPSRKSTRMDKNLVFYKPKFHTIRTSIGT